MNFVYNCLFCPSYGTILGLTLGLFSCIIYENPTILFLFLYEFYMIHTKKL